MGIRISLLLPFALALAAEAPPFEGNWLGNLPAGPANLRLALHLAQSPGGLTATMDSLDQGAMGLPSKATVTGRSIRLDFPSIPASFEGTLSEDGQQIAGTFTQSGAELPLTLAKVDALPEMRRPQDPVKPYPYDEQEVTYAGDGVKLAGTLTLPRGRGPHPAVLLLTGSGAQDRNESLMGHRPFLVLADALTRRGIAVLRMDDRGVGGSTGNVLASTEDDLTDDALAGVAFLRSRKEIDSARIGLVGHSEGGMVAALAASRFPGHRFHRHAGGARPARRPDHSAAGGRGRAGRRSAKPPGNRECCPATQGARHRASGKGRCRGAVQARTGALRRVSPHARTRAQG